jgi:hypothetical protein
MEPAIATIIGASTGAVAAIFGSFLSHSLQKSREERKWRNDQKAAAYAACIKNLLRIIGTYSKIPSSDSIMASDPMLARLERKQLSEESRSTLYDDLSELQYNISLAIIYCGHKYHEDMEGASERTNGIIRDILQEKDPDKSLLSHSYLQDIYNKITWVAQNDLSH